MSTEHILKIEDFKFIKESLEYTKLKFENYTQYPSQEFKQQRIQDVTDVLFKVNEVIRSLKASK